MSEITAGEKHFFYDENQGENLLNLLLAQKLLVDNPCSGKGVCGKCRVRVVSGKLPPPCETEKQFLGQEELNRGIRLACTVIPKGDLQIELLHKERKHKILSDGYVPEFAFRPAVRKQRIHLEKASLEAQTPAAQQIRQQTGVRRIAYEALKSFAFEPGEYTAVIAGGNPELSAVMAGSVIALEKGDTCGELYGICMDIGTTTVVVSLIHLADGAELATASRVNAQKELGLDVLSRISREMEDPDNGKKQLQSAIVQSVNEMIQEVCEKSGVKSCNIYEITVAANCTMMHMFLGIDARPIGKSPYSPIFTEAQTVSAEKIGLKAADCAKIYCLPSVSAYIGADIVAGAYVCQLQHAKDRVLFIDIGTNGEIVLSDGGRLLCCSCAAGPALEGMNISCGMRAAEGAIEDVQITETGVKLSVIGDEARAGNADVGNSGIENADVENTETESVEVENAEAGNSVCPEGICGSGILAAVKELVRTGLVRKDGAFIKKEKLAAEDYRYPMLRMNGRKREFILTNQGGQEDVQNIQNPDARLSAGQPLFITQGDIRQVQLAKGAILSGFKALLKKAGISMEELDRILIAGQFGAHLPAESLTGTGILPKEVQDKLNYVGNSSKTGAYMALMSREVRSEMEKLAEQMEYMELGNTEGYERLFAECMMFPERSQANHPSDFF